MPGHVLSPKNCAFALGDLEPHLIHGSLDTPETRGQILNCISIGSGVFAQLTTESRYFTTGRPFPLKITPSYWWSEPPFNTRFLGLTRILNPNGISIGSVIFAQLTAEHP